MPMKYVAYAIVDVQPIWMIWRYGRLEFYIEIC